MPQSVDFAIPYCLDKAVTPFPFPNFSIISLFYFKDNSFRMYLLIFGGNVLHFKSIISTHQLVFTASFLATFLCKYFVWLLRLF